MTIHPFIYAGLKPGFNVSIWQKIGADKIITTYCDCFQLNESILRSRHKSEKYADGRKMLSSIFYNELRMSKIGIGRLFNRDHSTIIYEIRCHENLMMKDSIYRYNFDQFISHMISKTPFEPKVKSSMMVNMGRMSRADAWNIINTLKPGEIHTFKQKDYLTINSVVLKANNSKIRHYFKIYHSQDDKYDLKRTV